MKIDKSVILSFLIIFVFHINANCNVDSECVVSILNRVSKADSNGVFKIFNVPTGFGKARVRANCIDSNGQSRFGYSPLSTILPNFGNLIGTLDFTSQESAVKGLSFESSDTVISHLDSICQLRVRVQLEDGRNSEIGSYLSGLKFLSTAPSVATVDSAGLVIGHSSGRALIIATLERTIASTWVTVRFGNDEDGDGMPDDWEIINALNPREPLDANDDSDLDGLTHLMEFRSGTKPRQADTDNDEIKDGEEAMVGRDGFITLPTNSNTDGDPVPDGLEVQSGTDPTNPNDFNLAALVSSLEVTPSSFHLVFNTVQARDVFRQLRVTGILRAGGTIDLTDRALGTRYTSNDLTIANFGPESGRIYAGQPGNAVITVRNGSLQAQVQVTVESFSPQPLSSISLSGPPTNVEVEGGLAYVSAGHSGVHIVDVSNPSQPVQVATYNTPGYAHDLKVRDSLVYVADGASGLVVLNVSSPENPVLEYSLDSQGETQDISIFGNRLYAADGGNGVLVYDLENPARPQLLERLITYGVAGGVDANDSLVAVASGYRGVEFFAIDPSGRYGSAGSIRTSDARDVLLDRGFAFVADYSGSLRVIGFGAGGPALISSMVGTEAGYLLDLTIRDDLLFGADIFFVNGVPIVDIANPRQPLGRTTLNFPGDATGMGVAVDAENVYLAADDGRLYIGQYQRLPDDAGFPPEVKILSPSAGAQYIASSRAMIQVQAKDDVGVSRVELSLDGQLVGQAFAKPYTFTIPITGERREAVLQARAIDRAGNIGVSQEVRIGILPNQAPTVAVVSPNQGSIFLEGQALRIRVGAGDDVGLRSVEMFANGGLLATRTVAPYEFTLFAPQGDSQVVLVARATDVGGVSTHSTSVTCKVVPDPMTAVEGRVVDSALNPVPGATVTILSRSTTTGNDGEFHLDSIPTLSGIVQARAEQWVSGRLNVGHKSMPPSPGNVTEMGNIPIMPIDSSLYAGEKWLLPLEPEAVADFDSDGRMDVLGNNPYLGLYLLRSDPRGSLLPPVRIPDSSTHVSGSLSGDFNGDGRPDLAVVVQDSTLRLVFWEGRGDGSFEARAELLMPPSFATANPKLSSGDLDGDGRLDLVFGMGYSTEVLPVLNRGSWAFETQQAISLNGELQGIQTLDFNRDGRLDILVWGYGVGVTGNLAVYLGSDAGYELGPDLGVLQLPMAVAIADLDRDGYPDIVAGEQPNFYANGTFYVYRNQSGAGIQFEEYPLPDNAYITSVAIADADRDGHLDVVLGGGGSSPLFYAGGNTAGGFRAPRTLVLGRQAVAGDFTGDGNIDLMIFNSSFNSIYHLPGDGTGRFPSEGLFKGGLGMSDMAIVDLDKDGTPEIVVANGGADSLLMVPPLAGPLNGIPMPVETGLQPDKVATGDLNRDGIPDLVVSTVASSSIAVTFGQPGASWSTPQIFPIPGEASYLEVGDMDRDGFDDIVLLTEGSRHVTILYSNGQGGVSPGTHYPLAGIPASLRFADIDSDGRADLICVSDRNSEDNSTTGTASAFVPGNFVLSRLMNLGNRRFAEEADIGSAESDQAEVVDFDRDGSLDVLAAGESGARLWKGGGDGSFVEGLGITWSSVSRAVSLEDFDGDGYLDVALSSYADFCPELQIARGNSSGTYSFQSYAFPYLAKSMSFDDVNGDGYQDLVVLPEYGSDLAILTSNGLGGFQAARYFNFGNPPERASVYCSDGGYGN